METLRLRHQRQDFSFARSPFELLCQPIARVCNWSGGLRLDARLL
jgi:hypothetical protein